MATINLLSWNMKQKVSIWQTILESNIDAAMLQEAKAPPAGLLGRLTGVQNYEWSEPGLSWQTAVAGLVVSEKIDLIPIKTQPLGGNDPDAIMVSRTGNLAVAMIRIRETDEKLFIVSMYSTWMNPVRGAGSKWIFADASAHRLISDLCGLIGRERGHKIIAAGDLNLLYGYGENGNLYWRGRYNTVFDRMKALGMRFVGPQAPEGGRQAEPWPKELPKDSLNVPTFYHSRQNPATASRQLDFVFASESIADRVTVKALNSIEDWGPSDHCRIMIELGV